MPGTLSDQSFQNIQGNILAPFNKPYQLFLFLNFRNKREDAAPGGDRAEGDPRQKARTWLQELMTGKVIASTEEVVRHKEEREAAKEAEKDPPPRAWVGLSFTSSALVTLDQELAADLVTYDAFWRGAIADREYVGTRRLASPALTGDVRRSDPSGWVIGGPGAPVDALLTIAADNAALLEEIAERERDRAKENDLHVFQIVQGGGSPTEGQYGARLDGGVEHFGFRDGISQPGIRGFMEHRTKLGRRREAVSHVGTPIIAAGEFVLGYEREPGSYPIATRPVPPDWMHDGSFQVLLRLTQDVYRWRTQMNRLRAAFQARVDVEAKAVGRTKEGLPLASGVPKGELNDFTYDDDPQGLTTPAFCHIRTMNPRDKAAVDGRTRFVLRRGIPFGPTLPVDADDDDGVERGLVFNAFMASIEGQFEYLARKAARTEGWLPARLTASDGPDPVIGASDAPCHFPREGKEPIEIHFKRFVQTSGAAYAFAPSLPTLRRLAGLEPT
jgi:deferrochelatase/peroxidase EfeB